ITDLPPETMLSIFHYAVAPAFLVSPAYAAIEPWLVAMDTKRSLSLVCRSWHQTVAGILYRDIGFRSIGQIAAFLDTLLTASVALTHLVRSITVACHVPSHHANVYNEDMRMIFMMCRRLHTFSTCSRGIPSGVHVPLQVCPATWITHVVNLHLSDEIRYEVSDLMTLLAHTSLHLHSLHLALAASDDASLLPELVFGSLTTLRLTSTLDAVLHLVTVKWSMPRIQRVTLVNHNLTGAHALQALTAAHALQAFTAAHGARIEYLHLRARLCPLSDEHVRALQACPRLAHLVIAMPLASDIAHPTVQHIDVWDGLWRERAYLDRLTDEDSDRLPSLRNVRTLDFGLWFMVDLPLVLRPDADVGAQACSAFDYPGVGLRQTRTRVWRTDMDYVYIDPMSGGGASEDGTHSEVGAANADEVNEDDEGSENDCADQGEQDSGSGHGSDSDSDEIAGDEDDDGEWSIVHSSDTEGTDDMLDGDDDELPPLTHDEALRIFRCGAYYAGSK
ncbi:hypothetical protein HDZ31DRAFT_32801, partial [Schizophyllum fasciatum]